VIVLSKVDLADAGRIRETEAWMAGINRFAQRVPVTRGEVDPALLLDTTSNPWTHAPPHEPRLTRAHQPAEHAPDIDTVALRFDDPVPHAAFDVFLDTLVRLRGADLLRVKGIVRFDDAPQALVVQGVRHVFDAPRPLPVDAAAPAGSALVVIARQLRAEHVHALWHAVSALAAGSREPGR